MRGVTSTLLFASLAAAAAAAMRSAVTCAAAAAAATTAAAAAPPPVQQLRLSATADATQLLATWATANSTAPGYRPSCEYGLAPGVYTQTTAVGTTDGYTAFGIVSPALHRATLTGLKPGRVVYYYRCGDARALGLSPEARFHTAPRDGTLSFVFFADMGVSHSNGTAAQTARLAQGGALDLLLIGGDVAYADNRQVLFNGTIADGILDDFYNEIAPTTKHVPTMYAVGNHELQLGDGQAGVHCFANGSECRGLAYVKRVAATMPTAGSVSPFYYSFSYGPVHFLVYSTEHPFAEGSPQWRWVQSDLQSVDRAATPWTVAVAHRPMICSNTCACARGREWGAGRSASPPCESLCDPLDPRLPRPRLSPRRLVPKRHCSARGV